MRPLLLDLFCGAGGAAMGYHRAGFDVVGVDIEPQPNYPFPFVQADALDPPFNLSSFDAIHASPPCQAYSTMGNRSRKPSPKLIDPVRELIQGSGLPGVIENVPGAMRHLRDPKIWLEGSFFGLGVHRRRWFELIDWFMFQPELPRHTWGRRMVGVYGRDHDGRRLWGDPDADPSTWHRCASSLSEAQEAMGMDWADWYGTKEAIPPAYTEWIGTQLLAQLEVTA